MTENTSGVDTNEAGALVVIGNVVGGAVVEKDGAPVIQLDGLTGKLRDGEEPLETGFEGAFFVEAVHDDHAIVSKHKADRLELWEWIHARIADRAAVEATVVSTTRGGMGVTVNGLHAILGEREYLPSRSNAPKVGDVIEVIITQYRDRKNQLIVSERALVEGSLEERKQALLEELEVGQVLTGEVRRFASFGAFVDLGGLDALLHVKDMAWRRIDHPREATHLGEILTLQVLEFDRETEKVSVGLKQLIPDPWLNADERYTFNTQVNGRVVGMTKFGAFVMLEDGIEGLVHVSEMSWTEKIQSPKEAVSVGDAVTCWVLRCETDRRRLGLSLKDPENNPWLAIRESLPIGTEKDFVISKVVDFGLFVELDGGLDGLIHVSDFSWAVYEGEPSEDYEAGQTVRAIMLDIDEERGRANLGIKQLCADLTTELLQKYTLNQEVDVVVESIQDDVIYAAVESGLDGVLKLGENIGADDLEVGQALKAKIVLHDIESKRLELQYVGLETASNSDESDSLNDQSTADATTDDAISDSSPEEAEQGAAADAAVAEDTVPDSSSEEREIEEKSVSAEDAVAEPEGSDA